MDVLITHNTGLTLSKQNSHVNRSGKNRWKYFHETSHSIFHQFVLGSFHIPEIVHFNAFPSALLPTMQLQTKENKEAA